MCVGKQCLVAASNNSCASDANHVLQAAFFEAICEEIDPNEKSIVACFPPDSGMDESCFKIPYDMLVLGEKASHCSGIESFNPPMIQSPHDSACNHLLQVSLTHAAIASVLSCDAFAS